MAEGSLATADIIIIVLYFIFVIIVGLWVSVIALTYNITEHLALFLRTTEKFVNEMS